jgi:hypothetical protein
MGLASPSDGFAFIVRVMNAVPPSKKRAVYTIPAGVPFATTLVQGITMLVDDDPAELRARTDSCSVAPCRKVTAAGLSRGS